MVVVLARANIGGSAVEAEALATFLLEKDERGVVEAVAWTEEGIEEGQEGGVVENGPENLGLIVGKLENFAKVDATS